MDQKEVVKQYINNTLDQIEKSISVNEVEVRVGKRVDNKEMVSKAEKILIELEQLKDAYTAELKALE